jgi:hypothetical protein
MVNLLIYLADQLLRGCQSADNQFQALQNQEIEGLSVHGSRLPEIEAKVAFGTWMIFVSLFWATCRLFSIFLFFWILEHFCLWILLLCLPLSF